MVIHSSRLIFREFKVEDWVSVHKYAGNLNAVKFMDWGPNSEQDTKIFIQASITGQKQEPRSNFDFAITLKDSDEVIGTAGIRVQDVPNQAGDFGYILNPDFWGKGLGTEVARALVAFGFDQLKLHRLWATCRPDNVASARVLEKAGLRCEGLLKSHKKIRGSWVDSYLYAIIKEETKPSSEASLSNSLHIFDAKRWMKTRSLTPDIEHISPAGAEVRSELSNSYGSVAHLTFHKGQISPPVGHKTVVEFWHILSGKGEIWRRKNGEELITPLEAGVTIEIPLGTDFQYRSAESEDLVFLCVSMPPWPGPEEVKFLKRGAWSPTGSNTAS